MSLTNEVASRARSLWRGKPRPEAAPVAPAGAAADLATPPPELSTEPAVPSDTAIAVADASPRRRTGRSSATPRTPGPPGDAPASPRRRTRRRPAAEPAEPPPEPTEPADTALETVEPAAPEAAESAPEPEPAQLPSTLSFLEPAATGPSRDLRLLLVEDVPQVVERVRELLRSQTALRLVAVASDGRKVDEAIAEHRPDVVLVDVLLQGRVKGPAVIERIQRMRNPLPCVAITLPDRPLEREIERRVDAVVSFPFGTFDLVRAVRGAVTAGAARNPTLASRVVAIFSAKGGVGKTTIALNLAVALQQAGLRTALVDGSLQFADVRRMLGFPDDLPSIIDLPTDAVRASDLEELMIPGPAGIGVLLAPPRLEQAELVTTRDLDKILDMLRRTYHAVVIDTPSSLGETTLAMLDAADVVIQVVTPETAALDITRLAAQAFVGIGYPPSKLRLLLNRADTQGPVGRGQVHAAFGREPDHTISSDWALVARCNAGGVPFMVEDPAAAVSADMRAVAGQVASVVGVMATDAAVPQRRRGRA